jgi:hypothetical protein
MQLRFLLIPAAVAFLTASASAEIVVDKTFRALPFSDSLGVDGIYKIQLRDANNRVHTRMVTAEVFNRYALGESFDDRLQPGAGTQLAAKTVRKAIFVAKASRKTERPDLARSAVRIVMARRVQRPARARALRHAASENLQFAHTELNLRAEFPVRRAIAVVAHVSPAQDMQPETEGF